jgi:hypothetical protein
LTLAAIRRSLQHLCRYLRGYDGILSAPTGLESSFAGLVRGQSAPQRGSGPNVPVRDLSAGRCSSTATFNLNFLVRASRQTPIPPHAGERVASLEIRFGSSGLDWDRDMKFATGLLAAVLLLAGVGASHAAVRIADDRGGMIGTYVDKYQSLRTSGETVIIDGLCASACTIVLGAVPHNRICVTSRANLGFHAAWDFGAHGREVTNPRCDADAVSLPGTAPDRGARRAETADDFPARKAADEHVPPLPSRRRASSPH